jgi:hypothetical protein
VSPALRLARKMCGGDRFSGRKYIPQKNSNESHNTHTKKQISYLRVINQRKQD